MRFSVHTRIITRGWISDTDRRPGLGRAAFSLAAALAFHNNFSDQNQMIYFLKNIAIVGGLLQIFAFGAGSLSLDARRALTQPSR